jgi:hypothetical protein
MSKVEQEIANAQAEYAMKRYDRIVPRLEPLLETEADEEQKSEIRWLIIEAHERLAEFEDAFELLEEIKAHGSRRDRIRATAHLDIFEQNPRGTLRRVGERVARKFLSHEQRIRGKKQNALADADMMKAALEEYCYQILTDEEVSMQALRESMQHPYTLAAIREMPSRSSKVASYLPFAEDLDKVEESLERVDAILPGYAQSYQIDLVRSEADHVYGVLVELFREVMDRYPDYEPPSDETGRLTKEGREEWRERCEEFAEAIRPLLVIAEYLEEKVSRYPNRLRELHLRYRNIVSQLREVRAATLRKKERTRV